MLNSGISLAVMIAGFMVWAVLYVTSRSNDLPEALQRAQNAGIPIDHASYIEFVGGRDDGQGTFQATQLDAALREDKDAVTATIFRTLSNGRLASDEFQRAMKALGPTVQIAEEMATRPILRFSIDRWEDGTRFREVIAIRTVARILANRSRDAQRRGDWDVTIRDVETIQALAGHLRASYHYRHLTGAIDLDWLVMTRLAELAMDPATEPDRFEDVSRRMADYEVEVDFVKVMQGEAYVAWSIAGASVSDPDDVLSVFRRMGDDMMRRELLAFHVDKLEAVAPVGEDLEDIDSASRKQQTGYSFTEPALRYLGARRDRTSGMIRAYSRNLARKQMYLALVEYLGKIREGQSGEVKLTTRDPYADQPVRLVLRDDGYELVSVGWDRRDDGGLTLRDFGDLDAPSDLVLVMRDGQRPRLRGR